MSQLVNIILFSFVSGKEKSARAVTLASIARMCKQRTGGGTAARVCLVIYLGIQYGNLSEVVGIQVAGRV
jgi:hypothetical protein